MSTVRLMKTRGEHKAGAVISLPYLAARDLVAAGEAEYPGAAEPGATGAPGVPMVKKSDLEAARRRTGALEAENSKLKADLAAAEKLVAELEKAAKK